MIYITGAGGYIGSTLCSRLREFGYSFKVIKTNVLTSIYSDELTIFFQKDKVKPESVIIHVAASGVNSKNLLSVDVQFNMIATEHLIFTAHRFGIKKFIVLGTCFEYGLTGNLKKLLDVYDVLRPADNYSLSKVCQFHLCQFLANKLNLHLSYLRLFQVFGGAENKNRLYPSMISAIKNGYDFHMSSGTQIRDFTHINSVVNFIINEVNILSNFQIINVSSGIGTSVREFVNYYWIKFNAKSCLRIAYIEQKEPLLSRLVGKPTTHCNRKKIDPFNMHPDP